VTEAGELWPAGPVALPARVRLGDETYTVRAIGSHELLHVLAEARWTRLVPSGLRERDRLRVARRLYDPADALDFGHLWDVATTLGGRLAGTSIESEQGPVAAWWAAHRLAQFALGHWMTFDGWCARRGFDPHTAPVHRVIAVAWQFRIDHRETEGAGKDAKPISIEALKQKVWLAPGVQRARALRFTAAHERETALAALREATLR
jgi:hypothetical protein